MTAKPRRKFPRRPRQRVGPHELAHLNLFDHVTVGLSFGTGPGTINAVSGEERVSESVVHPSIKARIGGVVRFAPVGKATDGAVPVAHDGNGRLDFRHGAERRRCDIGLGPCQPAKRILLVTRVLEDAGRHFGVRGLE